MIVSAHGSRFYGGQIDRIELGFCQLGHVLGYKLHNKPDLIYSNDAPYYDEAIEKWLSFQKEPKLILNILDIPHWLPEWPKIKQEWLPKLSLADKVTCISQTVQKDVYAHLGINAEVIYNPIKPVYPLPDFNPRTDKDIFALFVGRALAPNKRVRELVKPLNDMLIQELGKNFSIHIVGSENPGFGTYHGIVNDEELNKLYNRSIFTIISSKQEGLNLPLIESLCAHSIPIVCKDMSTADEFSPPELICEPTVTGMIDKITSDEFIFNSIENIWHKYGTLYRVKFSPKSIASNIISVYNTLT